MSLASASCLARFLPALAVLAAAGSADAAKAPDAWWSSGEVAAITPTSWWFAQSDTSELRLASELPLMRRYREPAVERVSEWRRFWQGRYGPSAAELSWSASSCEPADASAATWGGLAELSLSPATLRAPDGVDLLPTWALGVAPAPEYSSLSSTPSGRCKPGQLPYTVTVARYGAEMDTFQLLDCDGSLSVDALDRLSVLGRPPGVARPELPLPMEPAEDAERRGEWLPAVRLLDPRLGWVLARISEAFPHRPIYIISGYRREAHDGFHHKARALDMFVMGVKNEQLFAVCRRLRDVGCGYYPHNKFVHVDVRPPGTGHALWIDASEPGQPTRYVDGWPGVLESGALAWAGGGD